MRVGSQEKVGIGGVVALLGWERLDLGYIWEVLTPLIGPVQYKRWEQRNRLLTDKK